MSQNFRGCSDTLIDEVRVSTSATEWRSQKEIREIAFGNYSSPMVWAALRILKDRGEIESMSALGSGGKMLYRLKPKAAPLIQLTPGVKLFFDITKADIERINKALPLTPAKA